MLKLLAVFAASLVLAYISQKNTAAITASGRRYSVWNDWAYLLLVTILVLFAGLRTSYNDTGTYLALFDNAGDLTSFFRDPENLNPFKNPLFHFLQSCIKSWTGYGQCLVFVASVFSQACFLRFFKRYAPNFVFSIFLYFTLGTFVFSLAAMKQVLAMATLTLAFPYLEKRKWLRFYILVFVAMLLHTYAIIFAILPLFRIRPWGLFTFMILAVTVFIMTRFESAITAFMEQANDLGKTLADYEVFGDATINVFRLAVYAVPPLISLFFSDWVLHKTSDMDNTMIHMGIMSFAFMLLGTQAGANMFGRMGNYFEFGTLCCLPWMLKKTFNRRSYRLVSGVACVCFIGFFVYANAINGNFGAEYKAITFFEFIENLLASI